MDSTTLSSPLTSGEACTRSHVNAVRLNRKRKPLKWTQWIPVSCFHPVDRKVGGVTRFCGGDPGAWERFPVQGNTPYKNAGIRRRFFVGTVRDQLMKYLGGMYTVVLSPLILVSST